MNVVHSKWISRTRTFNIFAVILIRVDLYRCGTAWLALGTLPPRDYTAFVWEGELNSFILELNKVQMGNLNCALVTNRLAPISFGISRSWDAVKRCVPKVIFIDVDLKY